MLDLDDIPSKQPLHGPTTTAAPETPAAGPSSADLLVATLLFLPWLTVTQMIESLAMSLLVGLPLFLVGLNLAQRRMRLNLLHLLFIVLVGSLVATLALGAGESMTGLKLVDRF